MRTDQEIVDQTEVLAKFLLEWRFGYEPENDSPIRNATHPKAQAAWNAACIIQEMLTATDPENSVVEVDDQDTGMITEVRPNMMGILADLRILAMEQAASSRIPECGVFGAIAQDLDYVLSINNICTLPPAGWHCTRPSGHEGPCAAIPNDRNFNP